LQTGLTDADLDAVVPARPDAIMLPKAEGGASVVHADAKLAVREALAGLPDGHVKMIVLTTETAAALFRAGSYAGASARLIALTWGAEDLSAELGAERNRDADGRFLDPYRLARVLCLAGAAAAEVPALDTVYVDFPQQPTACAANARKRAATGLPERSRSTPRRCRSSTSCSRRRRKRSPTRKPLSMPSPKNPGAGVVAIGGVMVDRPHLKQAERVLTRANPHSRSYAGLTRVSLQCLRPMDCRIAVRQ
jgi:citrate lyase subunit beta/citryl-CoA lyase